MRNLLDVVRSWRRLRRPRESTEAPVEVKNQPEPKKVRFLGFGISDGLREGLRRRGFEECENNTIVITHSPAPSFIEKLRGLYETVVVIGPPGPWIDNKSLVNNLKGAGAAGVYEWPLKETEECAAELARMLNEALGTETE